MVDIAIMIEGQDGVDWDRWKEIAETVESAGFHGLFRSDHFTNPDGPVRDALELWTSLTWLAETTERIEFGPLVAPVSFRDPIFAARIGKDIDNLSSGRLTLGIGAGWQVREHESFGYDLLDVDGRFARYEEALAVIRKLLRDEDAVSFDGEYYQLQDAQLLPRPQRATPLLVGGNSRTRTIPLAAEYADEWNGVFLTPGEFRDRIDVLDEHLDRHGREPSEVKRSLMTRVIFGDESETSAEVESDKAFDSDMTKDDLREDGILIGDGDAVSAQLEQLDDAGVDRVMLQWMALDDLERLERMAEAIL